MDTISINLIFRKNFERMEVIYEMEDYIKNIKSSNGYKYCDVLSNSRRDQILIKISYPRYFYGNNAYLIKTSEECLEVQEHFIERIKKCSLFNNLEGIELTRLDIPFTYIMDEDKRFSDYSNIFKVMGEVYFAKNPKGRPKAFIDLITEEKESLIFTDSKVQSGYNSRIIIYDQYLNLKNKLSEIEFKRAINDFKSLPDRMRIEVSKRIRRTPFSLKEFEEKDFFYYYKKEFKEYLIKNLFDFDEIEKLYYRRAQELGDFLKEDRKERNFSYESFLLINEKLIYDYDIVRQAVIRAIDNRKTQENAITVIRKILKEYEYRRDTIVLNTYEKLEEIMDNIF